MIGSEGDLDRVDFERGGGLVPVVTQDARTGAVLMLAHANRTALQRTLQTGEMWYWSRSRRALWHKGATSGNVQRLVSLHADCDGDAIVAFVIPAGPACHTGEATCFGALLTLAALARTIEARARDAAAGSLSAAAGNPSAAVEAAANRAAHRGAETPADRQPPASYTRRLLADENLRAKKLGEELAELVLACARGEPGAVAEEAADLLYHTLVAARAAGVSVEAVLDVLTKRALAASGSR